jgi:hypothetical protein
VRESAGSSSFCCCVYMNCSAGLSPHASLCSIPTHPERSLVRRQQAKTPTLLNLPIVHYITREQLPTAAKTHKPKYTRRKMKQNRDGARRRHSIIYKDCAAEFYCPAACLPGGRMRGRKRDAKTKREKSDKRFFLSLSRSSMGISRIPQRPQRL